MLQCDPAEGISRDAFQGKLYGQHRKSFLRADVAAVRRYQAQVRGEAPATFDEQGALPPSWRTKVDQKRKRRYYYRYEGSPTDSSVGLGPSQWQRPADVGPPKDVGPPTDAGPPAASDLTDEERREALEKRLAHARNQMPEVASA